MFENLQDKLNKAIRTLKGSGRITDVNVASTVKEIRRALTDADVNFKVAKDITDQIREEAIGQKIVIAVEPGQMLVKIVHDKLTELMGGQAESVNLKGSPAVVLIAGLQGSGKTTFSGKLAHNIKKQGRQVLLAACDIYRPAAIAQLQTLGQQIGVEVYAEPDNKDAVQIAKNALKYAKENSKNVLIVDTAGRLAIDEAMMQEVENVKKAIEPTETLFVVDSMTGQDAVNTAKTFNDRLNFDGVVLTKLDGDARGGAALSIRHVVEKPIKYMSTGEKMEDLDIFYPDRMASRILGMGDVLSLVERAQQAFDEEEAARINKQIRQNQFNFEDFYSQLQQIKKMGNIKDLMGMIPGLGGAVKDVDISNDSFKPIEAIISSMTLKERKNPDLIDGSRRRRIATGSGTSIQQVNNLMKQFEEMRKMMKTMNKVQDGKMKLPPMMKR
ncbi:signal recognition particle protein [Siphonobacter aquaeclarae]|jgi:signal recognition particle subunit SRP54|uniref:Signal recognition particle protein n=1 Tax=Siphonobacter aquaeclarae TaxID=563176 RepID=A0A1G9MZP6_9BACT|nr:signal recognition particle protein [Siphonobacter aquaeclarae]MBO9636753.1 signal recognition particle protein [Siphonobacter aquaeclarae]SDL79623.1 signal recognition particle subunit FFH/SRP54 (srp54) [Siphonobacter aquaeclarae]